MQLNKHYRIEEVLEWADTWAKERARMFARGKAKDGNGEVVIELYEDGIGLWMVIDKYRREE
jgi:hypothetical protein